MRKEKSEAKIFSQNGGLFVENGDSPLITIRKKIHLNQIPEMLKEKIKD